MIDEAAVTDRLGQLENPLDCWLRPAYLHVGRPEGHRSAPPHGSCRAEEWQAVFLHWSMNRYSPLGAGRLGCSLGGRQLSDEELADIFKTIMMLATICILLFSKFHCSNWAHYNWNLIFIFCWSIVDYTVVSTHICKQQKWPSSTQSFHVLSMRLL